MDLAYGFIAQALKTHDDLMAVRIQEQRRIIHDRLAEGEEPAGIRPGLMRRLIERSHRLGVRAGQDLPAGQDLRDVQVLRAGQDLRDGQVLRAGQDLRADRGLRAAH